mgnify:CR=1 FL=1
MKPTDYAIGGFVDDRIPRDEIEALLTRAGIDPAGFCDWLAPRIGHHRAMLDCVESAPPRAEEIEVLRDFQRVMKEAARYLQPGGLPPVAHALMTEKSWVMRKELLHQICEPVATVVEQLQTMAEDAERDLEAARQKPGKRSDSTRALLFSELVARLRATGAKANPARDTAAEILVLCRVGTPEDERALRRLSARGAKLRG